MIDMFPHWHPVFVHFTIAPLILSVATALFLIGKIKENDAMIKSAYVSLWLGAVITLGTLVQGLFAYYTMDHSSPLHNAMTDHRNWVVPASLGVIALALWSAARYKKTAQAGTLFLALLISATGALTVTAYKSGQTVHHQGQLMFQTQDSAHDHLH